MSEVVVSCETLCLQETAPWSDHVVADNAGGVYAAADYRKPSRFPGDAANQPRRCRGAEGAVRLRQAHLYTVPHLPRERLRRRLREIDALGSAGCPRYVHQPPARHGAARWDSSHLLHGAGVDLRCDLGYTA